jgi:hypothetical protein
LLRGECKPECSTLETKARITEAKRVLEHIFALPYESCLATMATDAETTATLGKIPRIQKQCQDETQPPVESLLNFKDQLRIPDADWGYVTDTFHLGQDCSIHYIRKLRKAKNESAEVHQTAGSRGYEINIKHVLTNLIRKSPPPDPSKVCSY